MGWVSDEFDVTVQYESPFDNYIQDCKYTMDGTPKQNGVAGRRIYTIMDMVKSMNIHK